MIPYVHYPLPLRSVEDRLAERGTDISRKMVRLWWNRCGPLFVVEIRKHRLRYRYGTPEWRWHLDEIFVTINGVTHYLWPAEDHEEEVLEVTASRRRDTRAALKPQNTLIQRYGRSHAVVTDRLASCGTVRGKIGNGRRQVCAGQRINNRAENSHQPFRQWVRTKLRLRRLRTLQKFATMHGVIYNHFNLERHFSNRRTYNIRRIVVLAPWRLLLA